MTLLFSNTVVLGIFLMKKMTTERYIAQYSEVLAPLNVRVITPDKLTEVLDGKSGRVKRE